jgi:hypothetical protein
VLVILLATFTHCVYPTVIEYALITIYHHIRSLTMTTPNTTTPGTPQCPHCDEYTMPREWAQCIAEREELVAALRWYRTEIAALANQGKTSHASTKRADALLAKLGDGV